MSVADKIAEFLAGEADYDQLTLLREARDELTKSRGAESLLCQDKAAPAAQGASGPTANVGELAVQIANELARVDGYDPEDVHGGLYDLRWMGGPVPEPAGDTWNMDYLPKGERIARTLVVAAAPPVEVDEATRLFNAGWYACAKLADRDDLPHDVGSPFHAKALAAALKQGVG